MGYGSSEQELQDSNSDILSDSMFSQLSFADEIKISRSGAQPIADVERQLRYSHNFNTIFHVLCRIVYEIFQSRDAKKKNLPFMSYDTNKAIHRPVSLSSAG